MKSLLHLLSTELTVVLAVLIILGGVFLLPYADAADIDFRVVVSPLPECRDEIDNDSDGFIDFPNDPQCDDAEDTSEASEEEPSGGGGGSTGSWSPPDTSIPTPPRDDTPLVVLPVSSQRADLNNDGVVDLLDFGMLVAWLGRSDQSGAYDLTGSGFVTLRDISILVYHFKT